MSELDGKRFRVRNIRKLPKKLALSRVDPERFTTIRRCDGANADFEELTHQHPSFLGIGPKMLVMLENFETRKQPISFYRPNGDLRLIGAVIFRGPREAFFGPHVFESLALPTQTGLVMTAFWRRTVPEYEMPLRSKIEHRIACWRQHYDIAPPSRGFCMQRWP